MKKTVVTPILLLALTLIPNSAFASKEETVDTYEQEVIEYDDSNINEVLYPDAINDIEKPELSDAIITTPEAVDKYTKKFAYKYETLKDNDDSSIYVEDLANEMLDDPDVTITKEMVEKKPELKKHMIKNVHRYLEVYKDDVEYEMNNNHINYDEKSGKYYIPQDEELREKEVEYYANDGSDIKYKVYRTPNKKQLNETKKKADEIVRKNIKSDMTDEDKIYTLADYLIKHTTYDIGGKKDSVVENNEYGALIKNATKCDGIARAYTMLLRRSNVPSLTVYGFVGDTNHAWNVVKVGDKWKIVDLTGSMTRYKKNLKNNKIESKYYLKTADQLKTHQTVKNSIYRSIMNLTK